MRLDRIVFIGVLCVSLTTAISSAQTAPAAEMLKTSTALLAVEQHWTQAEVHGDVAYVAQLLVPEYESVKADGTAKPRSAILASAKRNGRSDTMARMVATYAKVHPFGTLVRIEGNTGIVTFYSLKAGPQKGITSSDIFTYVNGQWHAVYSQHTAVTS